MAALELSPEFANVISSTLLSNDFTEYEKVTLTDDVRNKSLSVSGLKIMHKHKGPGIISYLKHPKLVFPGFVKEERKVKLSFVKRLELLRLKEEERNYNMMIYGDARSRDESELMNAGKQFSSMWNQVTIAVNMVVAILAAFGIGYYCAAYITADHSQCLIYGLSAGIFMMLLEMFLFILRAVQLEESFEKEITTANMKILAAKRRGDDFTSE